MKKLALLTVVCLALAVSIGCKGEDAGTSSTTAKPPAPNQPLPANPTGDKKGAQIGTATVGLNKGVDASKFDPGTKGK